MTRSSTHPLGNILREELCWEVRGVGESLGDVLVERALREVEMSSVAVVLGVDVLEGGVLEIRGQWCFQRERMEAP